MNISDTVQPDDVDEMLYKLFKWVESYKVSTSDFWSAYEYVLGVSSELENEVVATVVKQMQVVVGYGVPVNKLVDCYGAMRLCEGGEGVYIEYVSNLPLTNKEKRVLHSIVAERRSGTISFLDGDQVRARLSFSLNDSDVGNKDHIATVLLRKIDLVLENLLIQKQLGIQFEEM